MNAYAAIQAVGVSPDATNAHTPGVSLADVNTRAVASLSSIATLRGADDAKLELLAPWLPAAKAALDSIEGQISAVAAALEPWHGATSSDSNGHLSLQMQHPEKGSQGYDLGSPLFAVVQQCNVLLDNLPYVAQTVGEVSVSVFAGLARAAGEHLAQAKTAEAKASKELSTGSSVVAELKTLSEKANELVRQAQEFLGATTNQKSTVDGNAAEVEQKLARAREVSTDADTLQQRVIGFTSQFEAFETQMKARLDQFHEFQESIKEAQRLNGERETKINELTDKADTMIRGATTAGLSQSLEDTKALYDTRLQETQKYFLWSVSALLVCTLPIAAQIVPGPWQHYFTPQANGAINESGPWLSALGKLVLVIPGTWAAAFFASNYAELFHLSREYAHKAALAKSIDGFKREAPEYAQELVGSVFMEIQDNPGSRKSPPPPATPQNPVTKKFLEKVLEAIKVIKGGA
ncbi:hypothetical protein LP414_09270 [Polaromonas sp. P1(28)-13]|nr:hypothetical protein LP414_09270 [Polaromonas sp. P1(28)-13]